MRPYDYAGKGKALIEILDSPTATEQDVQAFLEKHTPFLPRPFLLGHREQSSVVISKLPIGDFKTDFAYVTKESDRTELVLVEIEHPAKNVFHKDPTTARTTSEFHQARGQLLDWVAACNKDPALAKNVVAMLLDGVMLQNPITVRGVLVMGRRAERTDPRNARVQLEESEFIRILPFDSLISHAAEREHRELHVFRKEGGHLTPKHLLIDSPWVLVHLGPSRLKLRTEDEAALRKAGHDLDAWYAGSTKLIGGKVRK